MTAPGGGGGGAHMTAWGQGQDGGGGGGGTMSSRLSQRVEGVRVGRAESTRQAGYL
jgi:hypothetical protein